VTDKRKGDEASEQSDMNAVLRRAVGRRTGEREGEGEGEAPEPAGEMNERIRGVSRERSKETPR
jgi:hypothetical protein